MSSKVQYLLVVRFGMDDVPHSLHESQIVARDVGKNIPADWRPPECLMWNRIQEDPACVVLIKFEGLHPVHRETVRNFEQDAEAAEATS
jgi:hypothetical protein